MPGRWPPTTRPCTVGRLRPGRSPLYAGASVPGWRRGVPTNGQVVTFTVTSTSLGCVVRSRFASSKRAKTLTTQVEGPAHVLFVPVWPELTVTVLLADPHQRTKRL